MSLLGPRQEIGFGNLRPLSLALQGGGSFGAFTWGFLDRLLEEENLRIDMVSGASAGALNAVLLADGLMAGGPGEARKRLNDFWSRVGHSPARLPVGPGRPMGTAALNLSTKLASPYQLNPLGLNPLRRFLADAIDFERLRAESAIRLLIAATRVKDGRMRLFREDEVTLESVLASTCLPMLHHAVEIDGEAYWDGGFSANPPVRQLVIDSEAQDIVLVQLMPDGYGAPPRMSSNISRRVQEIAFTTSLHKELEALDDLLEVCRHSPLMQSPLCHKLRDLRFHRVAAADTVPGLARESALDSRWSFLKRLKDGGRDAAESWLDANQPLARRSFAEIHEPADDTGRQPSPGVEEVRLATQSEKDVIAAFDASPAPDKRAPGRGTGLTFKLIERTVRAVLRSCHDAAERIEQAAEARRQPRADAEATAMSARSAAGMFF